MRPSGLHGTGLPEIGSQLPPPDVRGGPSSHSMPRLPITAAATLLGLAAIVAPAQDAPDLSGVDAAIEKGVAWLLKIQEADGSWRGPQPEYYHGMTALAVYTLIKCGLPVTHPAVAAGLASVKSHPVERTYDLGLVLMLYQAIGDGRPMDEVKKHADRLVKTMGNGKKTTGPRWGYPGDHPGNGYTHTDLSNTQYAILGLRAAKQSGYKAGSTEFWSAIARDLIERQEAYGGFGYAGRDKASASMTVAGITCLVVAQEFLGEDAELGLRGKIRGAINMGVQWLDDHWAVDRMVDLRNEKGVTNRWLYYYLYGLERFGAFAEMERIGKHVWYPEGAASILKRQKGDGRWQAETSDKGDDDTCFALLFLRRGSRASGGPRTRAAPAAAAGALTIASNGDNPLSAWIRALGPQVQDHLLSGAKPRRLTWMVGDAPAATIEPVEKPDALTTEVCHLRHTVTRNGAHRVVARLELASPSGETVAVLESNPIVVQVDNVEEPWQREAARDSGGNLIEPPPRPLPKVLPATASSSIDGGRDALKAIDHQFATHWLCGRDDKEPWIEVKLARAVTANVVKLTSASSYTEAADRYARPRDIEVRLNDGAPVNLRLEDTVQRKQWVRFTGQIVHTIRIRIRSVYRGEAEANAAGFKEIELFYLNPKDGAEPEGALSLRPGVELVLAPARTEAVEWRYTFEPPGEGWFGEEFRDERWPRGKSGFGSSKIAYASERTLWESREIWLRREFTLPKGDLGELRIEILHDDHADVWVNGVHAAFADAWSKAGYRTLPLSPESAATLRPGRNLIAVRCVNTGGPGSIDVSLVRLLKPR